MTRIANRMFGIGMIAVACALLMTACQTTDTGSSSGSGQTQETEGGFRAETEPAEEARPERKLELRRALGAESPRAAEIFALRYFEGYRNSEIAELLELTQRTVARDWSLARAWLMRALREEERGAR